MSDDPTLLLSALWALAAAGLAWHLGQIARQITYVTLADGRRQERRLPLLFRLLLPLTPNLMPFFRRPFWKPTIETTDRRLVAAGFEGLLSAGEFLALRFLLPLLVLPLWGLLIHGFAGASPVEAVRKSEPLLHALGALWCLTFPLSWLARARQARHHSIQRALPFVMDLLTLSVEAGMDFMTALQRNVERQKIDALSEELIRVIREIQLGKTRREALRDMARRVDLRPLRQVVNALCQADELGVSIGTILRIQADQIRLRRFERAETLANEAPVKMLFPLMFFIFPAVFLVLLGPVIMRLAQQGF